MMAPPADRERNGLTKSDTAEVTVMLGGSKSPLPAGDVEGIFGYERFENAIIAWFRPLRCDGTDFTCRASGQTNCDVSDQMKIASSVQSGFGYDCRLCQSTALDDVAHVTTRPQQHEVTIDQLDVPTSITGIRKAESSANKDTASIPNAFFASKLKNQGIPTAITSCAELIRSKQHNSQFSILKSNPTQYRQ